MNEVKLTRKQAQPILDLTFPEYRGRKIVLVAAETVTLADLNWGGGTRSQYVFLDRSLNEWSPNKPRYHNPHEGRRVELTSDFLVVEHTIFCGEDVGIRIYVHPSLMPKLLEG